MGCDFLIREAQEVRHIAVRDVRHNGRSGAAAFTCHEDHGNIVSRLTPPPDTGGKAGTRNTQVSAGSDDRLVRLYGERREMLTRYLTARLGSKEEAEDAVQEVFLKLHRADLAESLKNPGAFLFRAATNVAIDIIRQRQRARHRDRDWTEAHTSSLGIEPNQI